MALRPRRLPRIRTLLLATYLAVLLLPVAGIGILRLYESALIRQTEAELLAQAAVLAAAYRSAWLERAPPGALAAMPQVKVSWDGSAVGRGSSEPWTPLQPQLDLAETTILPRAADPTTPDREPDAVGRQVAPALTAVVNDVRRMTLAAIRIVDPWGTIVVSPMANDLGLGLAGEEEVAQALRGQPATRLRERLVSPGADYGWESLSRNTDLRVFVAVPVLADGHVLGAVLVSRTPRNIMQTLYSKRYALLELAIVLAGAVVALAWFAGYTVVRPTRQLAVMARRVAGGEVRAVQPLAAPMTREAQSLSESIVVLARTLEARAEDVRDLALGIGHELKTPLTGIRGSAELLRDHLDEMSAEERHRFLSNILADTDRLERLVRRILELARADTLTPSGEERCDVAEAAAEIAADLRRKGHRVSIGEMPATLPCVIDRASFDIVLSNLLENARQHGGEGVSVELSGEGRADGTVIDVADDGVGVSAANAGRIFDRFFTTARDAGGSGLGLAIARQRLRAFGGDIALVPSARGASFRIRLRTA
jgi:signal transduction histidine kinase